MTTTDERAVEAANAHGRAAGAALIFGLELQTAIAHLGAMIAVWGGILADEGRAADALLEALTQAGASPTIRDDSAIVTPDGAVYGRPIGIFDGQPVTPTGVGALLAWAFEPGAAAPAAPAGFARQVRHALAAAHAFRLDVQEHDTRGVM